MCLKSERPYDWSKETDGGWRGLAEVTVNTSILKNRDV